MGQHSLAISLFIYGFIYFLKALKGGAKVIICMTETDSFKDGGIYIWILIEAIASDIERARLSVRFILDYLDYCASLNIAGALANKKFYTASPWLPDAFSG